MRSLLRSNFFIALLALCTMACQQTPSPSNTDTVGNEDSPVTTIYVVRHGEKDTSNPADRDPALSADGMERAETLKELLKDVPVAALFTTNYKRTMGTLRPIAEVRSLQMITYEPNAFESLKNQVLQGYAGKTVVVAGHSNTVLSIVEAFGVEKPFAEVPETKYDHLFKIKVAADNTATLETSQYGKVTN